MNAITILIPTLDIQEIGFLIVWLTNKACSPPTNLSHNFDAIINLTIASAIVWSELCDKILPMCITQLQDKSNLSKHPENQIIYNCPCKHKGETVGTYS